MNNPFKDKIPAYSLPRNKFDLSHERKLSCKFTQLVPIFSEPVVPGDEFRVNSELFGRMAPMLAPIMHRCDVETFWFYVPYRLVWNGFQDFITQKAGGPTTVPQFKINNTTTFGQLAAGIQAGGLLDHLGFPAQIAPLTNTLSVLEFSQLPARCYQEIFNEWFRDQTFSPLIDYSKGDADLVDVTDDAEITKLIVMRERAWEKDYYTTSLPNPQYGNIQASAIVKSTQLNKLNTDIPSADGPVISANATGRLQAGTPTEQVQLEGQLLINELRKANSLQQYLEAMARSGQRFTEYLKNIWGVTSPDSRLQRPELLGRNRQAMAISEVLSTFDNSAGSLPQGTFTGHGVSSGQGHGFRRYFQEHGQVIGIMCVMPKAGYHQGLHRQWSKKVPTDFYNPYFANIGEQSVLNKEVFLDPTQPVNKDATWGYQSQYAEYKYINNSVHGDFRDSLLFWHLNRTFGTLPPLNEDFIRADSTEMDRIFANSSFQDDKLLFQIYSRVDALRPMPVHAIPSL